MFYTVQTMVGLEPGNKATMCTEITVSIKYCFLLRYVNPRGMLAAPSTGEQAEEEHARSRGKRVGGASHRAKKARTAVGVLTPAH